MTDSPTSDNTSDATNGGAAARAGTTDARLGVVLGDRLCVRCGFNLHGQTITREPHYQMLSVRCPECSTLASLQEYPVLGRWGQRFGIVFALLWLAVALGATFFTGLTLYGASEVAAGVTTLEVEIVGIADEFERDDPARGRADRAGFCDVHQVPGAGLG